MINYIKFQSKRCCLGWSLEGLEQHDFVALLAQRDDLIRKLRNEIDVWKASERYYRARTSHLDSDVNKLKIYTLDIVTFSSMREANRNVSVYGGCLTTQWLDFLRAHEITTMSRYPRQDKETKILRAWSWEYAVEQGLHLHRGVILCACLCLLWLGAIVRACVRACMRACARVCVWFAIVFARSLLVAAEHGHRWMAAIMARWAPRQRA